MQDRADIDEWSPGWTSDWVDGGADCDFCFRPLDRDKPIVARSSYFKGLSMHYFCDRVCYRCWWQNHHPPIKSTPENYVVHDPENYFDRLPVECLTRIFGFLPRKYVFGTCILICKRWREAAYAANKKLFNFPINETTLQLSVLDVERKKEALILCDRAMDLWARLIDAANVLGVNGEVPPDIHEECVKLKKEEAAYYAKYTQIEPQIRYLGQTSVRCGTIFAGSSHDPFGAKICEFEEGPSDLFLKCQNLDSDSD